MKVAQSQLRHTTSKITLDLYAQAVSADQQAAHKKVVQMSLTVISRQPTWAPTALGAENICLWLYREIDAEFRACPGHALHVNVTVVLVHDQLGAR